MQVICWVLGEYGVLAPGGARVVVERLVDLAEGQSLPEEVLSGPKAAPLGPSDCR